MRQKVRSRIFRKRVVIVEDNAELANGLALIVNGSERFQTVNKYDSCEEAIKNLKKDRPEIVLMDIQLPGMDGMEGTREIKALNPSIHVIILSVYDDGEFVFDAFRAGASGYLLKSSNYIEVIKALEEVLKGGAPMSSLIARMVIDSFRVNHDSPLTRRELQVLVLLSEGKTYSEIADELSISPETSKTHLKNIYSKLEVNSRSEALKKAHDNKFI